MGSCLSARVKAESPIHNGESAQNGKRVGYETSGSSSRSSSIAVHSVRTQGEILQAPNLKSFSYNDLRLATRNFRPDSLLGEGGFGCVYKGWIDENSMRVAKPGTGMVVAVKRLNPESFQGHHEWLTEINYLSQLHHPNLVKLVGYCLEDDHRMLVYEFMPKRSLENHLFRRAPYIQPLSWSLRMKIALDAAKGLAFLHSDEAKVIFRDFKTPNILLDSNYNAKLSDFGLAKDEPESKSHVSTRIMGTYGYAAPEYMATGRLTAKSDVYSFGVVLLELLSGRRAIDKTRPSREQDLVDWARPYLGNKRKIFQVMDIRLEGQYSLSSALKSANLAVQCLCTEPRYRPSMQEVVRVLQQIHSASETLRDPNRVSRGGDRRSLSENGGSVVGDERAGANGRPHAAASPVQS